MAETQAEIAARKEREKDELYGRDITGLEWLSAPDGPQDEKVEIAYFPDGAVCMRNSADPDTILRFTAAEWEAFVLGARDGEFDIE
ncbi:DUF397 domain-containing protein [Streptomyces sp. YIM 98790]|uniref:DUF397 domain-containing protein n=1 Tax=Streptomyces sp. YIM 98790 TaxID=2689077 RepID=UPI00140A3490|nr:DUF397 domain-containing protein [Streptomyces sp. YIM 98790]